MILNSYDLLFSFAHLAVAALLAICDLADGGSLLALAFPPFNPPSRPNATAAGFFPSAGGTGVSGSGADPVS